MSKPTKSKAKRRYARQPKASNREEASRAVSHTSTPKKSKAPTKISKVIALLERSRGASLDDIVSTTDWLPHTCRAALTGLRKKGHTIEKNKDEGVARYSIGRA